MDDEGFDFGSSFVRSHTRDDFVALAKLKMSPTPVVDIQPRMKEGEAVIRKLRDKGLNGRKLKAVVNGYWNGAVGGTIKLGP